ncbi:MAG: ATP-binding cassette domain-containing protein [Bacteroidales bacterium]|nr:ATP-binding cassette domain-containing protein [Bacteroidales bacterium]
MPKQRIIDIVEGQTGNPTVRMARPLSLTFYDGEQVAVVGDNAAGKTRLVETLSGVLPVQGTALKYDFSPSPLRLVSENIKYIAFRDTYDGADDNYYLQKRWNQQDIDDDTPTAGALLERAFAAAETGSGRFLDEAARASLHDARVALRDRLYGMFGLTELLDKYIILLSSGELRKFQLTRALLAMPRVLILDNPFIGLDSSTRAQLADLLGTLAGSIKLMIILVLPRLDILPSFITHVIPVDGLDVLPKMTVAEFLSSPLYASLASPDRSTDQSSGNSPAADSGSGAEIIRLTDVTIRYGNRVILKDLNWTVHEGECWALTGENGSGKSTLLSLICADNPQSYACNIELFGHRRGTGESIWDIKKHIGYVSPEMHRAYLKNLPALDIVASGLFDTVGLFMHATNEQLEICRQWMEVFGIGGLADRPYLRLSSGEQRLCLLARAFVKDPDLLILDEPMHGLDQRRCILVKSVIDAFMRGSSSLPSAVQSQPHSPRKTLVMVTHYESELPSCIDHRLTLTRIS